MCVESYRSIWLAGRWKWCLLCSWQTSGSSVVVSRLSVWICGGIVNRRNLHRTYAALLPLSMIQARARGAQVRTKPGCFVSRAMRNCERQQHPDSCSNKWQLRGRLPTTLNVHSIMVPLDHSEYHS